MLVCDHGLVRCNELPHVCVMRDANASSFLDIYIPHNVCVAWVSNENAYRRCTRWHSYTIWYAQDAPNVSRQCIPQSQMTGVVPSDTLVIALMWWALLNHDGWVHSINARAYPFHVLTHTDEPCLLIYRHKKCTTPSISSSNISKTYRVLRLNALLIWHKRTYRVSLYVYP